MFESSNVKRLEKINDAFLPVRVAFQPSFTRILPADDTRNKPRRIDVFVTLKDKYGDSMKYPGIFRFELFQYKAAAPDSRGQRFAIGGVQEFDLSLVDANQQHWDKTTRFYRFELELPEPKIKQQIVVQVTYSMSAEVRLENLITLGQ